VKLDLSIWGAATVGSLIERLDGVESDMAIPLGRPHSYRGYYEELAVERIDGPQTVAEFVDLLRSQIGVTHVGWKGGEFVMTEHTGVWVADEGSTGEPLTGLAMPTVIGPSQETT